MKKLLPLIISLIILASCGSHNLKKYEPKFAYLGKYKVEQMQNNPYSLVVKDTTTNRRFHSYFFAKDYDKDTLIDNCVSGITGRVDEEIPAITNFFKTGHTLNDLSKIEREFLENN